MLSDQSSFHGEEKIRLRQLIDVNTKDLAELSAEWGQRNQQQEERNMELLAQAESAAKDSRRLKDLLDKRTASAKQLHKELDELKGTGGGSSEKLKEADAKVRTPSLTPLFLLLVPRPFCQPGQHRCGT
jgi:hypothetical protein